MIDILYNLKFKTHLFFRKPEDGFNSIENVFHTLESELAKHCIINKIELPEQGVNLKSIARNLKFVRKNRADVNHITGHVNYIALCSGRHTVLTIHDMISGFQSHRLKNTFILIFWFWIPSLLAKRITVISEYTQDEVKRLIPFAKKKVRLIGNPISSKFTYHPKVFNSKTPRILCVGTKPNKNLSTIFKALENIECELIILGKLHADQIMELQSYDITYKTFENMSYDEVITLYIDSDLLCFASTFEGFGMPIIEAQAIGRPVVTSNIGAMKETAKTSACLVNPYDYKSIEDGIIEVCNNETYRNELIKKGLKNVERFQASVIAREYMKVYEEVLNS